MKVLIVLAALVAVACAVPYGPTLIAAPAPIAYKAYAAPTITYARPTIIAQPVIKTVAVAPIVKTIAVPAPIIVSKPVVSYGYGKSLWG